MKVLWVNPSFLDYRVPVYRRIFELTDGNFYLIYSKRRMPQRVIRKIENALGNNAIGLERESIIRIGGKGDFANTGVNIPYQKNLYKIISSIDADVIIGEGFFQWTPAALFRAIIKNKKFLIAYERTAHTERNCPRWRSLYRSFIDKFTTGYLANGKLTKEYLTSLGFKMDKIFIGGMSADSESLSKSVFGCSENEKMTFKKALQINNGVTYLYVGQMIERKGVIYVLRAWLKHIKNYPNDNLILVGEGPLLDEFLNKFNDEPSIHFVGAIDYDKIYKYYAIADVFIIPTLEDNWSLVVPEAMACGLPVACSIYNGCHPELIIEGQNGKLFDPLIEQSVIEGFKYFHDVDLLAMGRASVAIENGYNANSVADNIYNACKICISKK